MNDPSERLEVPLNEEELAALDVEAQRDGPVPFALYGIHRRAYSGEEPYTFVAWGLEFTAEHRAMMWVPGGATWKGNSAEQLLQSLDLIAHVRLRWLDGRAQDGPIAIPDAPRR